MTNTFNKTKQIDEVSIIMEQLDSLRKKIVLGGDLGYVSSDDLCDLEDKFGDLRLDIYNHFGQNGTSNRLDENIGVIFDIAEGNFQSKVSISSLNIKGGDHLDHIGMAINQMSGEVAKLVAELKSYKHLIEKDKRCVLTIRDNGDIVNCSDSFKNRFFFHNMKLKHEPIQRFIDNIKLKEDKLILINDNITKDILKHGEVKKVQFNLRSGDGKLLRIESNIDYDYCKELGHPIFIIELNDVKEHVTEKYHAEEVGESRLLAIAYEPPFRSIRNLLEGSVRKFANVESGGYNVARSLSLISSCTRAFELYSERITSKLINPDLLDRNTIVKFDSLFSQIHCNQLLTEELEDYILRYEDKSTSNCFTDPDLICALFEYLFLALNKYRTNKEKPLVSTVLITDFKGTYGKGVKIEIETNEKKQMLLPDGHNYLKFSPDQITIIAKIVEALKGQINLSSLNKAGGKIRITIPSLR